MRNPLKNDRQSPNRDAVSCALARRAGSTQRSYLLGTMSAAALSAATVGAWVTVSALASTAAEAKTPGKTYCFLGICHRVMTLDETRKAVGKRVTLHASHYDDPKKDRHNPSNLTSSGEYFRPNTPDNAASPNYPNGTVILAWNPLTYLAAVLRINNAGPYWGNRQLDVSRAAADKLGFAKQGVAKLQIQVVQPPTKEDVTYRKGRRYATVPGPIGRHTSFDLALANTSRMMRLPAPDMGLGTLIADAREAERALAQAMTQTLPADSFAALSSAQAVPATAEQTPSPVHDSATSPVVTSATPLPDRDTVALLTAQDQPEASASAAAAIAAAAAASVAPASPSVTSRTRVASPRLKPAAVVSPVSAPKQTPQKLVLVAQVKRNTVKAQRIALAAPRIVEAPPQSRRIRPWQSPMQSAAREDTGRLRVASTRVSRQPDWYDEDDEAPRTTRRAVSPATNAAERRARQSYSIERGPAD